MLSSTSSMIASASSAVLLWMAVSSPSVASGVNNNKNNSFEQDVVRKATLQQKLQQHRQLEGAQYIEDISGYNIVYGKCVFVKVKNDGDDDGNQFFYNGRYYAQHFPYASFFLCSDDECGNCDYETEYVTSILQYLTYQYEYVGNYCVSCQNQCRRRRLSQQDRRLDEEGDDDDGGVVDYNLDVECNAACADMCNYNDDGAAMEGNYLNCQEAYVDEETGVQYYSGPACSSDGSMQIGLFYDEDCTVKSALSYEAPGFEYKTFGFFEESCIPCIDGHCQDMYADTEHCQNGKSVYGDDDGMPVCKTYLQKKTATFDKRKKSFGFGGLAFFLLLLSCCFCTTSYTYFIRHRKKKEDVGVQAQGDSKAEPLAPQTELPTVT